MSLGNVELVEVSVGGAWDIFFPVKFLGSNSALVYMMCGSVCLLREACSQENKERSGVDEALGSILADAFELGDLVILCLHKDVFGVTILIE